MTWRVVGDRRRLVAIPIVRIGIVGASAAFLVASCSTSAESTCADSAEAAVTGFTEAIESGDAAVADGFFAEAGGFAWYSEAPGRLDPEARRRDTLSEYLAGRIAQGARLELRSFTFTREAGALGHFGFLLRNEAGERINGKGAVTCETGKLAVLSLGSPE